MQKILLLDYDHTLYPSTLNTLKAVDDRINLYIKTFLGMNEDEADAARLSLWEKYGTTLKGLEIHHGVDRNHYSDFIHAIDAEHLPPVNPELIAWIQKISCPIYLFTNAREDWPTRGMASMGLDSSFMHGMFDIGFMDWVGKPYLESYHKVENFLRAKHGHELKIYFADDRQDNLETAQSLQWETIWVRPHNAEKDVEHTFSFEASALSEIDPTNFD